MKRNFKWMGLMLTLMAGFFTLSLTSCGDDNDSSGWDATSTPSALRHTWDVMTSTNGELPLTGVDEVIIDMTSGNTMRFIVGLTTATANATGASVTDYYLLSRYTFNFTHYSNGGNKGELRSSTNGTFPYEIVSGGVNLTINGVTYGMEACALSGINPIVPDAVYNYVQ